MICDHRVVGCLFEEDLDWIMEFYRINVLDKYIRVMSLSSNLGSWSVLISTSTLITSPFITALDRLRGPKLPILQLSII